jgi:hypothetical protein
VNPPEIGDNGSQTWIEFIRREVEHQRYEMSIHADDERLNERIPVEEMETALKKCAIIENYTDDPRGESCLVCGKTSGGRFIHIVCGKNHQKRLFIITVYVPMMPKWMTPFERNR